MAASWRRRVLLAVLAALVGVGALGPVPADAHPERRSYFQFPLINAQQCMMIGSVQDHGAAYAGWAPADSLGRWVRTTALGHTGGGTCNTPQVWPAGWIAHRGWVYRATLRTYGSDPGVLCIAGGWQHTQSPSHYLEWGTTENLWYRCNAGFNVPVRITHDIEGAVWSHWQNRALHAQARPLPTTWHDHWQNG